MSNYAAFWKVVLIRYVVTLRVEVEDEGDKEWKVIKLCNNDEVVRDDENHDDDDESVETFL